MPWPRYHSFQKWEECPRCGLDWPKSMLRREYTGIKVCPECFDPKGYEENLASVFRKLEEQEIEDVENDVL